MNSATKYLVLGMMFSARVSAADWAPSPGSNFGTASGVFTVKAVQLDYHSGGAALDVQFNQYANWFKFEFSSTTATDLQKANAFLSVLLTAKTTGANVQIFVTGTTSGQIQSGGAYSFSKVRML